MKIRNGFVSNSSSSSFVILLPENYSVDNITVEDIKGVDKWSLRGLVDDDSDEELVLKEVKKIITKFIKDKSAWEDNISLIEEILHDYVIASVEGGPDDGQIVLADNKKVNKILKLDI